MTPLMTGASILSSTTRADGVLVPDARERLDAGESVEVFLYDRIVRVMNDWNLLSPPIAKLGAIILLGGGKSSRMGSDKAALDSHGEPLLARVTRPPRGARLSQRRRRRRRARTGDSEFPPRAFESFATTCPMRVRFGASLLGFGACRNGRRSVRRHDRRAVPRSAFIARLAALRAEGDWDAVIPRVDGADHPLAVVYALRVRAAVDGLLARDVRRARAIGETVRARYADCELLLADADLRSADPDSPRSKNLNTPQA